MSQCRTCSAASHDDAICPVNRSGEVAKACPGDCDPANYAADELYTWRHLARCQRGLSRLCVVARSFPWHDRGLSTTKPCAGAWRDVACSLDRKDVPPVVWHFAGTDRDMAVPCVLFRLIFAAPASWMEQVRDALDAADCIFSSVAAADAGSAAAAPAAPSPALLHLANGAGAAEPASPATLSSVHLQPVAEMNQRLARVEQRLAHQNKQESDAAGRLERLLTAIEGQEAVVRNVLTQQAGEMDRRFTAFSSRLSEQLGSASAAVSAAAASATAAAASAAKAASKAPHAAVAAVRSLPAPAAPTVGSTATAIVAGVDDDNADGNIGVRSDGRNLWSAAESKLLLQAIARPSPFTGNKVYSGSPGNYTIDFGALHRSFSRAVAKAGLSMAKRTPKAISHRIRRLGGANRLVTRVIKAGKPVKSGRVADVGGDNDGPGEVAPLAHRRHLDDGPCSSEVAKARAAARALPPLEPYDGAFSPDEDRLIVALVKGTASVVDSPLVSMRGSLYITHQVMLAAAWDLEARVWKKRLGATVKLHQRTVQQLTMRIRSFGTMHEVIQQILACDDPNKLPNIMRHSVESIQFDDPPKDVLTIRRKALSLPPVSEGRFSTWTSNEVVLLARLIRGTARVSHGPLSRSLTRHHEAAFLATLWDLETRLVKHDDPTSEVIRRSSGAIGSKLKSAGGALGLAAQAGNTFETTPSTMPSSMKEFNNDVEALINALDTSETKTLPDDVVQIRSVAKSLPAVAERVGEWSEVETAMLQSLLAGTANVSNGPESRAPTAVNARRMAGLLCLEVRLLRSHNPSCEVFSRNADQVRHALRRLATKHRPAAAAVMSVLSDALRTSVAPDEEEEEEDNDDDDDDYEDHGFVLGHDDYDEADEADDDDGDDDGLDDDDALDLDDDDDDYDHHADVSNNHDAGDEEEDVVIDDDGAVASESSLLSASSDPTMTRLRRSALALPTLALKAGLWNHDEDDLLMRLLNGTAAVTAATMYTRQHDGYVAIKYTPLAEAWDLESRLLVLGDPRCGIGRRSAEQIEDRITLHFGGADAAVSAATQQLDDGPASKRRRLW